jgi:hypothetical protein
VLDGRTRVTGKYPHVISHHATPVCLTHLNSEDFYDIKFFVMFHGEVDRWIDDNELEIRAQMKAQDWLYMYSTLIEDYKLDYEQFCFNNFHE